MERSERRRLLRRGLWLEYATLGWNVLEGALVLWAAWGARSIGLAGFGLDSLIEIFASIVVVWQLTGVDKAREARAMRAIGAAFFVLGAYIVGQFAFSLISATRPAPSLLGMASLTATIIAMLLLSWAKRNTGRRLNNPVLLAESRVTLVDALLASTVLAGVGLNALFGWWWADPLSGLVIVYYAIMEGRAAWSHQSTAA